MTTTHGAAVELAEPPLYSSPPVSPKAVSPSAPSADSFGGAAAAAAGGAAAAAGGAADGAPPSPPASTAADAQQQGHTLGAHSPDAHAAHAVQQAAVEIPPSPAHPPARAHETLAPERIEALVQRSLGLGGADGGAAERAPPLSALERVVLDSSREVMREPPPGQPLTPVPTPSAAEPAGAAAAGALPLRASTAAGAFLERRQRVASARAYIAGTLGAVAELGAIGHVSAEPEERLPAVQADLHEIERLIEANQLDDMRQVVAELSNGLFDAVLEETVDVLRELRRLG